MKSAIRGVVQQIVFNRLRILTTAGRMHDVEATSARLIRKSGLPLQFTEIAAGDVVEVEGSVWPDGSVTATLVRDLSMYPHAGTFSGKIVSVDAAIVTFHSSAFGEQAALVTPETSIYVKNVPAVLGSLVPGMSVRVQGTWERSRARLLARALRSTYRLLKVRVIGEVVGQVGTDLTVVAGGAIYAVHAQNVPMRGVPAGQPLSWLVGRNVVIDGKHIAESRDVTAVRIRVVSGS